MSEQNIPEIKDEVLEQVAGGTICSAQEAFIIIQRLTEAYENLVDFTSHVIERVSSATK
jgi:hypothetical protein